MTLRGILEASFGNFICVRGFARISDLAKYSKIDPSYQRQSNANHVNEIRQFLEQGEYRYFPEILLGMPCAQFKYARAVRETGEIREESLFQTLTALLVSAPMEPSPERHFANRSYGDLRVSLWERKNTLDRYERKDLTDGAKLPLAVSTIAISGFENLENRMPMYRIDGNHRLEAAASLKGEIGNSQVPFCLMIFDDDEQCRAKGAMFFHNINYHALPIPDERNNALIATREDLFSDEKLLSLPAFGFGEYLLIRRTVTRMSADGVAKNFSSRFFRDIFSGEKARLHTFLLDIYRRLLNHDVDNSRETIDEVTRVVEVVKMAHDQDGNRDGRIVDLDSTVMSLVSKVIDAVCFADRTIQGNNDLNGRDQCDGVLAALVCFKCYRDSRYFSGFVDYIIKRRLGSVKGLKVAEAMDLFTCQMNRVKRTIFISMPFYRYPCEYHYDTIREVIDEINVECKEQLDGVELKWQRVDDNVDGKTFEINQRIIDGVSQCGLLIADLTFCNANVFHEVGMLMGKTYALRGHTNEFDMILLCDESESSLKDVKFNLHSMQIVRFKDPSELKSELKRRLLHFYKLGNNGGCNK